MNQRSKLKPGDFVRLLNEDGQGYVKHVNGDEILAEIDGFELSFHPNELVLVEHDDLLSNNEAKAELSEKDRSLRQDGRSKLNALEKQDQAIYELDLHIHELLDDYRNMSNGEILSYQMRCCRSFIQEAYEKRYPKVVLIHGVGEGVLRKEIHHYLDTLDRIEYHDAPYRTYGYGATEVIIRR